MVRFALVRVQRHVLLHVRPLPDQVQGLLPGHQHARLPDQVQDLVIQATRDQVLPAAVVHPAQAEVEAFLTAAAAPAEAEV